MDHRKKRRKARRYLEKIGNGNLTTLELQELQELLKTKFRGGDPEIVGLVEELAKYRNKIKWEERKRATRESLNKFLAEVIARYFRPW